MIAPYLFIDGAADSFRESMSAGELPWVVLPDVIDGATAAELRAALETAGLTRYELADRGRYHHNDTLRVDPLWEELGGFAADLAGGPVTLERARWIRQARGDYSLVKDDSHTRVRGRHLELTLDLSAGNSGEADVVYLDDHKGVSLPQITGVLGVIDRTPTSTRYLRPPTVRSASGCDVVRLIMSFAAAD
jgi:hypothetical protein